MMSNRKGVPPGAGAAATRTARRVMPAPARKTLATGLAREGKRPCCCRVQVDHARLRIALRPAPATSLQRAASSQTGAAASERRRKPGLPTSQLSWPHLQGQSSQDAGSDTSSNTSVTSAATSGSQAAGGPSYATITRHKMPAASLCRTPRQPAQPGPSRTPPASKSNVTHNLS